MPSIVAGNALDMNQNEILNFVAQNLAANPSASKGGFFYFSTADKTLKYFDGAVWQTIAKVGDIPDNVQLTTEKGKANGYASLDASSKVPISQLMTGNGSGYLLVLGATIGTGQVLQWNGSGFVGLTLGTVMHYIGTVATYEELPSSAEAGDVYNVTSAYGNTPAGTNWAMSKNGTWDPLGGTIDLSGYLMKNDPITPGTGTKITYDENGLVRSSTTLSASDIPVLDASKITSGVFVIARLPVGNADGKLPQLGGACTDGQVLTYDAASGKFIGKTPTIGNTNTYTGSITGDGTTTAFTFSHGLGKAPLVQVFDATDNSLIIVHTVSDATNVKITFTTAPASAKTYRVVAVA